MNRGVLDRQMFRNGGAVRRMQEGGMVPPGMPAAAAQPSVAQGPDRVDPAMMEQMLQQASTQFANIDQAGDYEEMMNAMRGDEMSIGERRQELASLVGSEDAQQTPESVLTLLQPVMQLAAVEQGIGGLAEEAMGSAVEGPMAEGIMSTVNMGGEEAPMPMEGGAPVQAFRNGGVVRMANGGSPSMLAHVQTGEVVLPAKVVSENPTLKQSIFDDLRSRGIKDPERYVVGSSKNSMNPVTGMPEFFLNMPQGMATPFGMQQGMMPQRPALPEVPGLQQGVQQRMDLYKQMGLQASDPTADIEEQRRLSQAQALFDIAGTAFAFAGPGSRTMSPAERLAEATQQTQLFDRLGGRAQQFAEFKRGREKEGREFERGLKLTALQGAETERAKALETRAGAEAQERQAAFDVARDVMRFDFTRGENETDRDFRARLATQAIDAQDALQRLRGSQSQEDIQLRGTLQRGLAELQGQIAADAQRSLFDFQSVEAGKERDFKESMQNRLFDNQRALQVLSGEQAMELQGLRGDQAVNLENVRAALQKEQIELRSALGLSNELQLIDARKVAQLETMEEAHDYNVDLMEQQQAFTQWQNRLDRDFRYEQNALNRIFQRKEARDAREFEADLRRELRDSGLEQAEIDRRMSVYMNALDYQLRERGLDQVDMRLALDASRMTQQAEMNVLGQLSLRANRLGDSAKARTIQYLSDPQVLNQYATGQLGDQTAEFEQLILDYTQPQRVWDGAQFVMQPGGQLNPRLVAAIEARKQSGLSVPEMGYSGMQEGGAIMDSGMGMLRENRGALAGASPELDLSFATGPGSLGARLANTITKIADYTIAPQSAEAINAVEALNTDTLVGILDARGQRSNLEMQRKLQELFPKPGALATDEESLNKTRSLIGMLNDDILNVQTKIEERLLPPAQLSKAKEDLRRLTSYRDQYQRLLGALQKRMAPREEISSELDAFFKSRM